MTKHAEEAKEFLESYRTAFYKLIDAKERLEMYRARILHSTYYKEIPNRTSRRDISDYVAGLENAIAKTKAIEGAQTAIMLEVRRAIDKLSNEKDRQVMYYRYIEFMSFREIAKTMEMSKNAVYIRHGKVLNRFVWKNPKE